MTTNALIIFSIAAILIWGGLIASTIHLIKNPDIDESQVPADH